MAIRLMNHHQQLNRLSMAAELHCVGYVCVKLVSLVNNDFSEPRVVCVCVCVHCLLLPIMPYLESLCTCFSFGFRFGHYFLHGNCNIIYG